MRIDESGTVSRVHGYLLVGNGPSDVRILTVLAERFDHSKVLRIPQTPLRGRKGLKASIESLTFCLDRPAMNRFILVIDREHVASKEEIEEKLQECGFECLEIEEINSGAYYVEAKRGDKRALIYIALLGFKKRIEENLAQLIKVMYNEDLEPRKKVIRRWLKVKGLRDVDLIRKARDEQLNQAFPSVTIVFRLISKNN